MKALAVILLVVAVNVACIYGIAVAIEHEDDVVGTAADLMELD